MADPGDRYWDSTNFICLLNESEAERARVCKRIMRDAKGGEYLIWTSALSIAETIKPKGQERLTPEEDADIRAYFEHNYIRIVDIGRTVAQRARETALRYKMKPRDAIHLASALVAKVDLLQTYNVRDFPNGVPGLTIEEPTWRGQHSLLEQGEEE